MPTCIITGCDFVDPHLNQHCHGDLWIEGDCYLFNACVVNGETAWEFDREPGPRTLTPSGYYWERRGVIVVRKGGATLSGQGIQYIGGDQG